VVDQPATIGALPVAVARACGHQVAYLSGLAMRRIAEVYPGTAKTDARDAFVIADAARTLPQTLRRVDVDDETLMELGVLVGYDDDLARQATRISNRIHGLLTGIHPALNASWGRRSPTRRCWRSCPAAADQLASARPGGARSPRSPSRIHPASARSSSPRSGPRWMTDRDRCRHRSGRPSAVPPD
jgi:Transposase